MRIWAAAAAAVLLLLAGTGCERYYECEISGYIRDDVSGEGVNKATVKVFFDNGDETTYQQTLTQTYNGEDGFFVFRRVVWKTDSPLFGDEGDLHDIRIEVTHEDYQPYTSDVRVVSGAANSVGDIHLLRAFFVAQSVEGRIRDREPDEDGEYPGINGLTVELYIPDVEIDSEEEARAWVDTHNPDDYANTGNSEDEGGHFTFHDVQWFVPGQYPAGEDERGTPWKVILRIDDMDYFEHLEYGVQVLSGETTYTLDDIYIDKREYTGGLEGWVIDPTTGDGINGARVEVYVPDVPLAGEEDVLAYVDENDPDRTGTTQTNSDEDEDGYFEIQGITWEIDTPPEPDEVHQRQGVILRVDANDYMEYVLYDDPDTPGFQPDITLVSNDTVSLRRDVPLVLTHFVSDIEGYVRRVPGADDTGENGVRISLYYDPDDPDLSELETFDPETADFTDRTTTGNTEVADETFAGYFRFNNINWDNELGGSLGNGKDEITIILFSIGVDFSDFEGNEDPRWQRFVITSTDDDEVFVLPDLPYYPEKTGFTASCEGYVRTEANAPESGVNGVKLSVFYDEDDPDLSELETFDPETARFSHVVTTGNQVIADQVYPGHFEVTGLEWENPAGGTLENGEDELTVILYSEHVDFSAFPDNTDPHWQRFVLVSGNAGNVLPDLLYAE